MKNRFCNFALGSVFGWVTTATWISANLTLRELAACLMVVVAVLIVRFALPSN